MKVNVRQTEPAQATVKAKEVVFTITQKNVNSVKLNNFKEEVNSYFDGEDGKELTADSTEELVAWLETIDGEALKQLLFDLDIMSYNTFTLTDFEIDVEIQ